MGLAALLRAVQGHGPTRAWACARSRGRRAAAAAEPTPGWRWCAAAAAARAWRVDIRSGFARVRRGTRSAARRRPLPPPECGHSQAGGRNPAPPRWRWRPLLEIRAPGKLAGLHKGTRSEIEVQGPPPLRSSLPLINVYMHSLFYSLIQTAFTVFIMAVCQVISVQFSHFSPVQLVLPHGL